MGHLSSYHGCFESYVKNGYIFVFSADDSKKLVTVLEKDLGAPERFFHFFQKTVCSIAFAVAVQEILSIEVSNGIKKFCIFNGWHLANGSSESKNP